MDHKFQSGDRVYIKSRDAMGYISSHLIINEGIFGDWYWVEQNVNLADGSSASFTNVFAESDLILFSREADNENLVSSAPLRSLFEVGI